jgi:alkylation response protein AidB-like acyl-CoA dehydrogenase
MPVPALLADDTLREAIRGFAEPRARDIDECRASVRDGFRFVSEIALADCGVYGCAEGELERMAEVMATFAQYDMSQAFALWCHRMCIEYLHQSAPDSGLRQQVLPRILRGEVAGSTAFASAMAHYLGGAPLPLTFKREADGSLIVGGRIAWASNIAAPFVSVSAAANEDDPAERVVFAFTDSDPGVTPSGYPEILALQSTSSTSILMEGARIPADHVITTDFEGFARRVITPFLVLQSAFCWGHASRSLSEVEGQLTGQREILKPDFDALRARFEDAERRLRFFARATDREATSIQELLQLRLDWGVLTGDSVQLEAKVAGGRGYTRDSETGRRFREAAFLPVQSPTEIQLRWLLSRFA